MEFHRHHHFRRRDRNRDRDHFRERRERQPDQFDREPGSPSPVNSEQTGSEADYLKSLVDSRAKVTVVLKSGERMQGRIRYYDRDCFSLGLSAQGPRIFLRKDSVSYIAEEE